MRVAFRADASPFIGNGHVMRCISLANALRTRGAECIFISRDHVGNIDETIKSHGYPVASLARPEYKSNDACNLDLNDRLGVDLEKEILESCTKVAGLKVDWIVVDHYSLEARWELALRPFCRHIMAIDDLANRNHEVDLLLDQNLGVSIPDYKNKVPDACQIILGPQYALLRPEFQKLRTRSLERRRVVPPKKMLISLGGADSNNVTGQVLNALEQCKNANTLTVIVVLGPHAPCREKVEVQARKMPFPVKILHNVGNMAELMSEADLAIGAAGSSSWERCCLGLPTLQIPIAENQIRIGEALSKAGAACMLQFSDLVESLNVNLGELLTDRNRLHRMSAAAAQLTDGRGAWMTSDCMISK